MSDTFYYCYTFCVLAILMFAETVVKNYLKKLVCEVKNAKPKDCDLSHYPYRAVLSVDGINRSSDTQRMEHALNSFEGVWADSDVRTKKVNVYMKQPVDRQILLWYLKNEKRKDGSFMKTLVLLRHGESVWNLENRFTGWTDVDLSQKGIKEAKSAGKVLKEEGYDFDIGYTSCLKRAIHTLQLAMGEMGRQDLPVVKSWKLNERHYGALQGMNKSEMAKLYGEEQIQIWRRSFDVRPPRLQIDDSRNPAKLDEYQDIPRHELPLTESLKDTIARVIPYYEQEIRPKTDGGKRVIIAAHGNSLRALIMYFDHLDKEEIAKVNVPTGTPLVYKFSEDNQVQEKFFLGDPSVIEANMKTVQAQGKAN